MKPSLVERMKRAAKDLHQPFSPADVVRWVKVNTGYEPSLQYAQSVLPRLARSGFIVRLAHGLYATKEAARTFPPDAFKPKPLVQPQKTKRKVKLVPGKFRSGVFAP